MRGRIVGCASAKDEIENEGGNIYREGLFLQMVPPEGMAMEDCVSTLFCAGYRLKFRAEVMIRPRSSNSCLRLSGRQNFVSQRT